MDESSQEPDSESESEPPIQSPPQTIPITFSEYITNLQWGSAPPIEFILTPGMHSGTPLLDRVMEQSFNEQKESKLPTSKEFIESLHPKKVSHEMVESETCCSICQEPFTEGDDIIKLPCDHYFHTPTEDCPGVIGWLELSNDCPLCRYKLPEGEPVEPNINADETEEEVNESQQNIPQQNIPIVLPSIGMIQQMMINMIDEREEQSLQQVLYASLSGE
jgi:hypothetical protein